VAYNHKDNKLKIASCNSE